MRILVTFALENEFAPWRKMRRFQRVSVDAWDQAYRAKVGSVDVQVIVTGAGRFAVQQSLRQAFDQAPDVCIVSGLAGALKPEYRPSAVLAARTVGDVAGTRLMRSDANLISRAGDCGAKVVEKFLVSDRVVSTAQEKKTLGFSGDAVDMESLYILAAASHQDIPAVAIRAISDGAESDLAARFRSDVQRARSGERAEGFAAARGTAASNWRIDSAGSGKRTSRDGAGPFPRCVRSARDARSSP